LAISEALQSDIRALRQAVRNANDGISLINVAEGALNEQSGIMIRLRELASQAATGTVGPTERQTIQLGFEALRGKSTASPRPPNSTGRNWSTAPFPHRCPWPVKFSFKYASTLLPKAAST
jgi:hypothetical protein